MLIPEPWDCAPDAMTLDVAVCVVCGEYCGNGDLIGFVEWYPDHADRVLSPLLAYHIGFCFQLLEHAANNNDDGCLLDYHTKPSLAALSNNADDNPAVGKHGLIRCQRKKIDLRRTHELLAAVGSPLIITAQKAF
jgi:hypothetical protein